MTPEKGLDRLHRALAEKPALAGHTGIDVFTTERVTREDGGDQVTMVDPDDVALLLGPDTTTTAVVMIALPVEYIGALNTALRVAWLAANRVPAFTDQVAAAQVQEVVEVLTAMLWAYARSPTRATSRTIDRRGPAQSSRVQPQGVLPGHDPEPIYEPAHPARQELALKPVVTSLPSRECPEQRMTLSARTYGG